MSQPPIFVTQPSLAPLEEVTELLRGVWERGILTHNGPLVRQLESQLRRTLGVPYFTLVSSGTIALQMALKALDCQGGEVITTPFTWVATLSAIKWENCTPVFADINPETFNIAPPAIEAAITPRTVAIMPVHVFGAPCDIDAIDTIAKKHGLKVIYDAAHAVGSTYQGQSVLNRGDISATSLHATKLLNTGEGGACITTNADLAARLERIRFFGHNDAKDVIEDGFNGKLTEVHAALGLANLKYHPEVLAKRKADYLAYRKHLSALPGITFQKLFFGEPNYSYFPVVFEDEATTLRVEAVLQSAGYVPRRYFYPSVNTLRHIVEDAPMPHSESLASRILCLPHYWKLENDHIERVAELVAKSL